MNWLIRQLGDLFSWIGRTLYGAFEWLLDSIGAAFAWFCNHVQAVAVGLVATVGGVMPEETLHDTWQSILSGISWLHESYWCMWFLNDILDFPEFLSRATYLAGVVLAAYAVRGVFMAVRAFLDLF